jgi:hypothetical protein
MGSSIVASLSKQSVVPNYKELVVFVGRNLMMYNCMQKVTSANLPTTTTTTGEEVEMGKFHRHKIIHFTDGSTMEEDVDTDEDVDSGGSTVGVSSGGGDAVEDIVNRTGALKLESDASKRADVPEVDTVQMMDLHSFINWRD